MTLFQDHTDSGQTKAMLLLRTFGCGNGLADYRNRQGGVPNGQKQGISHQNTALDGSLFLDTAAGFYGIVQKIRQKDNQLVRADCKPGQIVDLDLEVDAVTHCCLIFVIQNGIDNGMTGVHCKDSVRLRTQKLPDVGLCIGIMVLL